jgi:hypothetical protein
MGGMPDPVIKGPILEKLDDFFNDPVKRANLQNALNDLRNNQDLIAVGRKYKVLNAGDEGHLNTEWLPRWQESSVRVKQKIRDKLIEAAQKAIARNRGLDSYWICPGRTPQVTVRVRDPQGPNDPIVLLILTPEVP